MVYVVCREASIQEMEMIYLQKTHFMLKNSNIHYPSYTDLASF